MGQRSGPDDAIRHFSFSMLSYDCLHVDKDFLSSHFALMNGDVLDCTAPALLCLVLRGNCCGSGGLVNVTLDLVAGKSLAPKIVNR